MDFLFGTDMSLPVRFFLAFVIVLALIGGTALLVRRFGAERLGGSSSRGRQPRLAVIDAAAVDGRRRLILIRRDNVEHLLMIGGPSDVVVEANIVRAAAAARDTAVPRPPAAPDALPRPVPLGEGNMWPLQPTPEPAPAARPRPQVIDEPAQWNAEPEALPPPPPRRPEPRFEPRAEPRPEPRAEPRADPLVGLAAELARVQPEPPKPRAIREIARAPRPERMRAPPPPAADEEPGNVDQNLADMAQRLEAALRRPRSVEPRASNPAPRQAAPAPVMMMPADPMPSSVSAMEADPADEAPQPTSSQQPGLAGSAPAKPAPQKSVYDSLEQEMASLLGRPNSKT